MGVLAHVCATFSLVPLFAGVELLGPWLHLYPNSVPFGLFTNFIIDDVFFDYVIPRCHHLQHRSQTFLGEFKVSQESHLGHTCIPTTELQEVSQ